MQDTFIHIWQLLNPAVEFATRGRKEACRRLWESFDLERQRYTYRTIRDKHCKGEPVNENPYFAIEDNSHAPKQLLAAPTNYYGRFHADSLSTVLIIRAHEAFTPSRMSSCTTSPTPNFSCKPNRAELGPLSVHSRSVSGTSSDVPMLIV